MMVRKWSCALITLLGFFCMSCGNDDDDGNCRSCEIAGIPTTICDNGNNTATFSAPGTDSFELPFRSGESFEEFVERSCNTVLIP